MRPDRRCHLIAACIRQTCQSFKSMHATLRAYIDLTRLQFSFAWPLLFCSGYLLATVTYGGFAWFDLFRVALIGFFGFEAGLVLNDYIDREYDRKDIETGKLTKYWRVFGTRPIPAGLVSPRAAVTLILVLSAITACLIFTLPAPHSIYVLLLMLYCLAIEIFYQEEKRKQTFPYAQLIGRTDFALFPVAGYLCIGSPDLNALLYFAFFYPFALAHLGANDLIDVVNDRVRGMNTIPTMFSLNSTAYWIAGFTAVHILTALLFMTRLGWIARIGICAGLVLLLYANAVILKDRSPDATLKVLPCFHVAMMLYALGIAIGALV
jgi:4-hydroxybenzoate polyprenyltransferase